MNLFYRIKSAFTKHPEEDQVIETIEEIMDEREERGDKVLIDPDELGLLKNLFKLKDVRAGQVCIPGIDIVGIQADAPLEELKKIVISDKFTRLPVYEKSLDDIIGVIHVKDLLCAVLEREDVTVRDVMTNNVLFVPSSMRALDLLRDMQAKKTQMAVVVDEYGGTDGLITLEDLLEEIVGEIEDEHDALDTPPVLHRIGNSVIQADARIRLVDLENRIGAFLTPEEKEEELETIGGLVSHLSGKLPKIGETVSHASGLLFEVIDADSRHVKKVKITQFKKLKEGKKTTDSVKRFGFRKKARASEKKKRS